MENIESSDDPIYDLSNAVMEVSALLEGLKLMGKDMENLERIFRGEGPDEEAPSAEHEDWERNPRYFLRKASVQSEAA